MVRWIGMVSMQMHSTLRRRPKRYIKLIAMTTMSTNHDNNEWQYIKVSSIINPFVFGCPLACLFRLVCVCVCVWHVLWLSSVGSIEQNSIQFHCYFLFCIFFFIIFLRYYLGLPIRFLFHSPSQWSGLLHTMSACRRDATLFVWMISKLTLMVIFFLLHLSSCCADIVVFSAFLIRFCAKWQTDNAHPHHIHRQF